MPVRIATSEGPRALLPLAAALALSGCTLLEGTEAAVVGDEPAAPSAQELRLAELEAEVSRLKEENTSLSEKLAAAARAANASAAAEPPELKDEAIVALAQPSLPPAPEIKPEAVVAAADAGRALAGAPAQSVESSPRLVQPSFASQEEAVFENEAGDGIKTASVLFGVHLASYRHAEEARTGWGKLQREFPDELGLLEPRLEPVAVKGRGDFLRLIGGGFSSEEKAAALCATLKSKGVYCAVTGFEGEKLSLANSTSG